MLKICIISNHDWLENLLKQQALEIVSQDLADVIIEDNTSYLSLWTTKSKESWQFAKPIMVNSILELIKQLEQKTQENILHIGPVDFYPEKRLCKLAGEVVNLTQKEVEIITYLFEKKCEVDKQMLLNEVWGYSADVTTHTLETHIYNLRNKFLGKYDLITSNHLGYILSAFQAE